MNISKDEKDGRMIVRCEGRLDAVSSPQLEQVLNEITEKDVNRVLVDFNKVDYLSSAGMRLLLSMTKRLKSKEGSLDLFAIHDNVMEIIRMAGFEKILSIHPDEQRALSSA